jgi:molybdopterin-guanine dinucleotide biosynthesis protein A
VSDILNRNGKQSFREVLDQLEVYYVTENQLQEVDPSLQSFRDLDTPEDMKSI